MNQRKLSSEDKHFWRQVVESTLPLKKPEVDFSSIALEKPKPRANTEQEGYRLKADPKIVKSLKTGTQLTSPKLDVTMDYKSFEKMRRGKLMPEAYIDLHGMTVLKAHPALSHFVQSSYDKRLRLVLVITGKGNSKNDFDLSNGGRGILRRQVPQWLSAPSLTNFVLQVHPSHAKHGGAGAFYVYLKKNKSDN